MWWYLAIPKNSGPEGRQSILFPVLERSCRRYGTHIVLHRDRGFEAIVTSWLVITETDCEEATSRFLGPWRHTRLTSSCSSDVIRHHSPFHSPLQCPPTPWFLSVPLLTKFQSASTKWTPIFNVPPQCIVLERFGFIKLSLSGENCFDLWQCTDLTVGNAEYC